MPETIQALLIEPGKSPQEIKIPNTLEDMQKAVGGCKIIEAKVKNAKQKGKENLEL